MKPRLYLETTIPSYLASKLSRDLVIAGHQQVTQDWWSARRQEFEVFISQFVLDEAAAGDPAAAHDRLEILNGLALLEVTEAVGRLAHQLVDSKVIPLRMSTDALHIAVAAVHSMDYLMTWNCAHIANAKITRRVVECCRQLGFSCPVICTPEALLGD